MRRLIKYVPILMSVLMPIFMFSIGFSSWIVVTPGVPSSTGGSFTAQDVSEYLVLTNTDVFEYTSMYFIDSSNSSYEIGADNVGRITVSYSLTDLAKTAIAAGGLDVTFTLSYTDAIGSPLLFKTDNTSATVDGASYTPTADTARFTFTHSFSGTAPDSFDVVYEFTTKVGYEFRNSFGKYLYHYNEDAGIYKTTEFVTSAEAEVVG